MIVVVRARHDHLHVPEHATRARAREDQGALFAIITARATRRPNTQALCRPVRRGCRAMPRSLPPGFPIVGGAGAATGPSPSGASSRGPSATRSRRNPAADPRGCRRVAGVEALRLQPAVAARHRRPAGAIRHPSRRARPGLRGRRADQAKGDASGKFFVVQNSLAYDVPRVRVLIDRDRAAALGVPVCEIGSTLDVLLSESRSPVRPRQPQLRRHPAGRRRSASTPRSLGRFYVRAADGEMVPLSAVMTIETDAGPVAIEQFNQLNSATLSALPLPA